MRQVSALGMKTFTQMAIRAVSRRSKESPCAKFSFSKHESAGRRPPFAAYVQKAYALRHRFRHSDNQAIATRRPRYRLTLAVT
jgi:hypothetical protein